MSGEGLTFFDKTKKTPPLGEATTLTDPVEQSDELDLDTEKVLPVLPVAIPAPLQEKPRPDRWVRWMALALAMVIGSQVGAALGAQYALPAVEQHHRTLLVYDRVRASARRIRTAEQLGMTVPRGVPALQRDAETAAFAGDADGAQAKLLEIQKRWP